MKYVMDRKTLIEIINKSGYNRRQIAEASMGLFTYDSLRNKLAYAKCLNEKELEFFATFFEVEPQKFIDPKFSYRLDLPHEVTRLTKSLYKELDEDFDPSYKTYLTWRKMQKGFSKLFEQVEFINGKIFKLNTETCEKTVTELCSEIPDLCAIYTKGELFSSELSVSVKTSELLLTRMKQSTSTEGYNQRQSIFLFLYAMILFETIFFEEYVASAAQLSPKTMRITVLQYYDLATSMDTLKKLFIEVILQGEIKIEEQSSEKTRMLLENTHFGIMLMIATCAECVENLKSSKMASRYVNRKTAYIIIEELKKIGTLFGIKMQLLTKTDLMLSKFAGHYEGVRNLMKHIAPDPSLQIFLNNQISNTSDLISSINSETTGIMSVYNMLCSEITVTKE